MNKELRLVEEFHRKFKVPVLDRPEMMLRDDRAEFRRKLIEEEVREYGEGARNGDLENIAKELCDILYAVYGTILEHGLQDRIEKIFEEVHRSNMSKEYSPGKMIKGKKYFKPNVKKFLEGD